MSAASVGAENYDRGTAVADRGAFPVRRRLPLAAVVAIAALVPLFGSATARADSEITEPARLMQTDTYVLHSAISARDYRISVARPPGVSLTGSTKLPLAILLDADELFGVATDTVRLLQDYDDLPPLLLVGIGYPIGSLAESIGPRSNDFTPAVDRPFEELIGALTGSQEAVSTGGAATFLRFIREELKPFIATHYPVDPKDTALIGHSLGGMFGLYVLLHQPETFQRYIIGSPCLTCGGSDLFAREAAYASSHKDLNARLYMDVGSEEADVRRILHIPPEKRAAEQRYLAAIGAPNSVMQFRRFTSKLRSRQYPHLHLAAVVEPGETHESLPPILLSRGLRFVYSASH